MQNVIQIKDIFLTYMGEGIQRTTGIGILGLFLAALIGVVWYQGRKGQKEVAVCICLSILLIYNDISMKILSKFTSGDTFYRFFWGLPVLFLIAFVVVKAVEESKDMVSKGVIIVLVILMFMNLGTGFVTRESFAYSGSMEKIPEDVKQVAAVVEEHKISESPVCMMDLSTQVMIRVENPKIVWAVGRNKRRYFETYGFGTGKYRYVENLLKVVDYGEKIPVRKFKRALRKKKVEFVIIHKQFEMERYMKRAGLELVGESDSYQVYLNQGVQGKD